MLASPDPAAHSETRNQPDPRIDRLYAELNDRLITTLHGECLIEVFGIHEAQEEIWVQVAPSHDPFDGVVLHLSSHATADHALAALVAWFGIAPDDRPRIVEVMQLA